MTKHLINGIVAGVIAFVIALLCWRFLADASWGTAAGIAAGFLVGTAIVASLLSYVFWKRAVTR